MKDIIKKALYESINEVILGQGDSFTPYTQQDRERNFQGLRQMRNPSYDAFKAWKNSELKKGRNSVDLSWNTYLKEKGLK